MNINCLHLAANCNPKTNVITFLNSDLIAFAFADQIAIYSNSAGKIISSILDPTITNSRINCITHVWHYNKALIFCGYDTGSVNVFSQAENNKLIKIATYADKSGIISINLLRQNENLIHIFTNNHSSVVKHLLFNNNNQISLASTLSFVLTKIIESIASCISQNYLVVFLAGTDQKIHCYKKSLDNLSADFFYNFSLSGHEDAVTKLVLSTIANTNHFLLASSSKDGYIRIWKTSEAQNLLQVNKHAQQLSQNLKIYLESVLISHESSVTSLAWVNFNNNLGLASSSLDSTICVWGRDNEGNWLVRSRLGQFVGNKNAFFDVATDSDHSYLVAVNYTGAALLWKWVEQKFVLKQTFTGHFDQVSSIEWNHSGDFLVSVSKDQTTRIITRNSHNKSFHQISRAQIHGYDINAVSLIKPKQNTIDVLVCGADQKVIRILEPPACFANYLNTFTQTNLHLFFNSEAEEQNYKVSKPNDKVLLYAAYSEGGTQVLGLMTKMQKFQREKITTYFDEEQGAPEETQENQQQNTIDTSLNYNVPPHQDYLIKHTLWPELNKLYGHPHQIYRLCKSSDSSKLASSCKALDKDSAAIIIWDTKTWKILKIIKEHNYTVYGIEFSNTDKYFASVSKDRKLAVFNSGFELVYSEQVHLRAINCLSFHNNEKWILTGSRDKTIKLHDIQTKSLISCLGFEWPVCSVAFCKQQKYKDIFAVGLINGNILIGKVANSTLQLIRTVPCQMRHSQQINSLKWNNNLLASCSNDHSVRIFQVTFNQ